MYQKPSIVIVYAANAVQIVRYLLMHWFIVIEGTVASHVLRQGARAQTGRPG